MSFTLATGSTVPEFNLLGSDALMHTFSGEGAVRGVGGTLIFFTCNHCPHVIGSEDRMVAMFARCAAAGIGMVAVHSNETKDHKDDSFEDVLVRMKEKNFPWVSLKDDAQTLAMAFGAERTPHYFLFDVSGKLVYSGRMDNSPRNIAKVETHELEDAIGEMVAGKSVSVVSTAPVGCNIKWWDREKHWMPNEACDLDYLLERKG